MKTPDFTPPALAALAGTLATNLVILFGLHLGAAREAALLALLNGVVAVGVLAHDAVLRRARAQNALAIAAAAAAPAAVPPYRRNEDGSWTRTADGRSGSFGPHGFTVAA